MLVDKGTVTVVLFIFLVGFVKHEYNILNPPLYPLVHLSIYLVLNQMNEHHFMFGFNLSYMS